jgi:hypothetical protein
LSYPILSLLAGLREALGGVALTSIGLLSELW